MNASLNQTSNDELESTTFPSVSKELSKVQPVSQNLPPNDAKASPVEPVTQTATVSTVVTTVNPNVTVQPVCDQPAHIVSSNTLQTTVVTTVGSTSVASVADVGAAISIAATAAQREPTDSSTIPSSSAVQDNILQSTKEPVVSSVPETLSKTKVSLQNLKSSKDENYEIENENQQLKELIADIRWKRDKFRLLNGKLENEIKRQLQLINKYRSFLISTFESRPTYAFQQIFERLKGQIPDSSKKYVKEKHDWSCPEERRQQVPSGVSRLENTASANASAMTWNHFAKASASAVNTKHRNSSESSELTGSSTYVDRPLTGANQFQERSFKGNEDYFHSSGAKGRSNLWTPEEDELFMKAFKQYGTKWKHIQKVLPNKSRQQIQSHGAYLLRLGKLNKEDIQSGMKQVNARHDEQKCNDDSERLIDTYNDD